MTKGEAVEQLRNLKKANFFSSTIIALDIAIEALTQESTQDLISREDAVALVIKAIHGTDNKEIKEYLFDGLRKQMWSLPSAESTGAMDEAIQKYIKDGYMQPIGEDLISRQDAIRKCCGEKCGCEREDCGYTEACSEVMRLESLPSAPSAEAEDRLYIKIYADDEPSVMAEKLYQICGETQNGEVSEWLKEYFPSASDSRQRGEWIEAEVLPEVYDIEGVKTWGSKMQCDQCGFMFTAVEGHIRQYNYCPNCGARMYKGGEDE